MRTTPPAPASARPLATVVRDHEEALIQEWMRRVREDPDIPEAKRLREPALRDDIPRLLTAVRRTLEGDGASNGGRLVVPAGACVAARAHARRRASEGYELTHMLRELRHLRDAVIALSTAEGVPLEDGDALVLHGALDASMIAAADAWERGAHEELKRQATLIEQSYDAVILWVLGGAIVSWNRGAEELYGWTSAEAVGKVIHQLLQTEVAGAPAGPCAGEAKGPRDTRVLERILARDRRWEGELLHTVRDGRRLRVESRIVITDGEDGPAYVLETNRDMTERKRAEAEREHFLESERAARVEAERATRMRDEFVATVSHELRTPLNAILGWTAMLRSGKLDGGASEKALEVVERNARAQAELVEDLLDISRIGSGKLRLEVRRVDISAIVENAVASHLPAARAARVRLDGTLGNLPCAVQGDPGRLEQIVSNLLSNAVKFTPAGGRVGVILRRAGSRVEIIVQDSGKGIDPAFLPHVFDRFRQADASLTRQHRGLGLGLSLVKYLVEQHGGTIRAESAGAGQGATFTVSLPIAAVARPDGEPISPIDACESLDGAKVLLVDDEEDARELMRRILADCHAVVVARGSAAEALEEIPRFRPDVILSDIGMPELDGYDLIRKVRALDPTQGGKTPAVAVTAFARPEDRLRALRAGYQMHLAKPVDQAELIVVVANITGRLGAPAA